MSPPPPPNERSHQSHYSGRRNMYGTSQSSRPAEYSSLGDALGGVRQPQQFANTEYQSPSVSGGSTHSHIGPDGRAQYTTSSLYDYPYSTSSYEQIPQYGPSSLPPMRTGTASPASYSTSNQPIAQYNVHSTPYPSTYPQAPYVLAEGEWGQSPQQSFAQDAVQPTMFVANRSDVVASPQIDPRTYAQQQFSASPVNVYPEERASFPGENPPLSKGKAREYDVGHGHRSPPSAADSSLLDYSQLLDTYGQLQRECAVINSRSMGGSPDSLDAIDSLMRAAKLGLQLLQPASSPVITAQHRGPSEESRHSAETENASPELHAKRQTENAPAAPDGQKCLGCGATATPEWRRGPLGPRTLCNACGLVYAKMIKKRGHDTSPNSITGVNQPQHHAAPSQTMADEAPSLDSPIDGNSDDEQSYGSQGQH